MPIKSAELAALKSLFLMLMGQNGDRGLPGGKPGWGPAGRAALDRVLSEYRTRFHGWAPAPENHGGASGASRSRARSRRT